jgi:hypothetical protein
MQGVPQLNFLFNQRLRETTKAFLIDFMNNTIRRQAG